MRVLLVVAFVAAAWVASPLWVGILLGTVMAFSSQPLYVHLVARMANRRHLAAAIVTFGSGVVCLALLAAALYVLTDELVTVATSVQRHLASNTLTGMMGPRAAQIADHLGLQRPEVVSRAHDEIAAAVGSLTRAAGMAAQAITHALLGLLVALLTMYSVLVDGARLSLRLERLLPFEPSHTRALMREFREVGRSALLGNVATALVQGGLAAIGYAIAGVPQAVTWGVFTALASFLPIAGTTLVWVPVGVYQLVEGQVVSGVFTLAWGSLVVAALADYVIRPRIVKGQGNPLLMLIALLGGIEVLGLAGLIVGPILMSLFLAVLRIYEREFEPSFEH